MAFFQGHENHNAKNINLNGAVFESFQAFGRKTEPPANVSNAADIKNIVIYTIETVKELKLEELTYQDVMETGKAKSLMLEANAFLEKHPDVVEDLKSDTNFTGDLSEANAEAGNIIGKVRLKNYPSANRANKQSKICIVSREVIFSLRKKSRTYVYGESGVCLFVSLSVTNKHVNIFRWIFEKFCSQILQKTRVS
jgi:hypothetical protein